MIKYSNANTEFLEDDQIIITKENKKESSDDLLKTINDKTVFKMDIKDRL